MSDIEDLYREIILDHYRSPRNAGELETPPATKAEGFNPLCGDEIVVYLILDDAGIITDLKVGGQGCSISQSSASMMSAAVKGKTVEHAREVMKTFKGLMSIAETGAELTEPTPDEIRKLGDLAALRGVVKFPTRIKCATLSWNTLDEALNEAQA
ncbi:MAG: SUF system NifU family Fe-S cluster assembly protein [Acidimicrobiales bacterium]|nr:SUF system NifU family Fe-S cluster assembly protein [Acidimicrobiales bacterium]